MQKLPTELCVEDKSQRMCYAINWNHLNHNSFQLGGTKKLSPFQCRLFCLVSLANKATNFLAVNILPGLDNTGADASQNWKGTITKFEVHYSGICCLRWYYEQFLKVTKLTFVGALGLWLLYFFKTTTSNCQGRLGSLVLPLKWDAFAAHFDAVSANNFQDKCWQIYLVQNLTSQGFITGCCFWCFWFKKMLWKWTDIETFQRLGSLEYMLRLAYRILSFC